MKVYRVERTGYPEDRYVVDTYTTREEAEKRKRYEEYETKTKSTGPEYVVVEVDVKEECTMEPNFKYRLVASYIESGPHSSRDNFNSDWFDSYEEVHDRIDDEEFIREILSDELNEELEDWQVTVDLNFSIERKHGDGTLTKTDLHGDTEKEEEQHWK